MTLGADKVIYLSQFPVAGLVVDAVNSSSEKFRDPASRPVLQRLTDLGQDDLLHSILEKLPPANLLKASRVCCSIYVIKFTNTTTTFD